MNKLRIAIMGCAAIAQRSVVPALIESPHFKVVAAASRSLSKAEAFAQPFGIQAVEGYENLLKLDIDAVYIPLPSGLQVPWVDKCLDAGLHVLVEKSFGLSEQSVRPLIDKAQNKGLLIKEDFMFEYHSQQQIIHQMLKEKRIGDLRCFRSYFGFPPLPEDNFRYLKDVGGGALADSGAYTVKSAAVFLGDDLRVLSANMRYDALPFGDADSAGAAHLITQDRIDVFLGWGFNNFYQCGLEIWGSKGIIRTNRTFTARAEFKPRIAIQTNEGSESIEAASDNHFLGIVNAFALATQDANNRTAELEKLSTQVRLMQTIRNKAKENEG